MEQVEIKFKKLSDNAQLPSKTYAEDNCFDIYATEDATMYPKESAVVKTGIQVAYITPGFGFVFRPRSGLGFKHGIQPHLGEIDNGFRGELSLKLYNLSAGMYAVKAGDRIAQMKVEKVYPTTVSFTDEIVPAERGANKFGSSGK